jgi:uncharacterized protein YacL
MNHSDSPFGRCLCDRFSPTFVGVKLKRMLERTLKREEEVSMRTSIVSIAGLIGGLLTGFIVSGIIGISAFLLFGGVEFLAPIKFLPLILAIVGAVAAPIADSRRTVGR